MLHRLAPTVLALLLLLLPAAGCGDDSAPAPGPPRERFGTEPAERVLAIELIRSELVPVTDLVALGHYGEAIRHLEAASAAWSDLDRLVRADDQVLSREVGVAFDRVRRALDRRGSFDSVRDVASPLGAQLLGGVREQLVERDARLDPGVSAVVLTRLLERFDELHAQGGRFALQYAFGILERSQAVARDIATDLGPRRDAVVEGLKSLRQVAYPEGIELPDAGLGRRRLGDRTDAIRAALRARFGL